MLTRTCRQSKNQLEIDRENGYTLVELLVTMIVFALALTMVYTVLLRLQSMSRDVGSTADAASEVRIALAQIDKQVRSGNVLYSPADESMILASCTGDPALKSGTCMRVYTQTNGLNKCVQWQVIQDPAVPTTSLLRMRSWSTDWNLPGGSKEDWQTQAKGLVLNPSKDPFALNPDSTQYGSRLLDIRFEAHDARRSSKPSVISASLSGRNTNYGYDAGLCAPAPPA